MYTNGFYSLWSLWLTLALMTTQSSLKSLTILHRNATASLLVPSVWQCYCGYCCSNACVKPCLKNLMLTLQPSCFQTPMISACHSISNVQVSCVRISFCISQAAHAVAELLLLKIRLTSPLCCLPEWAASCSGHPFPTASCQCSRAACRSAFCTEHFCSPCSIQSLPITYFTFTFILPLSEIQYSECYMYRFGDRLPELNPSSNTYWLCDLKQVTTSLCLF